MPARQYSSVARQMSLQGAVTATDSTITVDTVVGLPNATPFTLAIDKDTSTEELVSVTSVAGQNLQVARGIDGTAASPHNAGAIVVHAFSAQDLREPQDHLFRTSAAHGITGSFVGTSDTQTLDNKTFVSASGLNAPLTVRPKSGQVGSVVKVQNAAGTADLASIDATGRFTGPGVNSTSLSTFSAGSPAGNALVVQGASSQVVPVVSVKNAGGTQVASIDANGAFVASGGYSTAGSVAANAVAATTVSAGTVAATATSPTGVPVTAKGAASQTADLQQWQTSSGTALTSVAADGKVTAPVVAGTATDPAKVPVVATGAASQTANLQEWRSSAGTAVASVGPTGIGTFASVVAGNVPKIQVGTLTAMVPALGSGPSGTVTFPGGAFSSAPTVFLTMKTDTSIQTTYRVGTVTTTNFNIYLRNDRTNDVTVVLNWLAIGD